MTVLYDLFEDSKREKGGGKTDTEMTEKTVIASTLQRS